MISIHAPREGCDCPIEELKEDNHISIHAPREGCDGWNRRARQRTREFQSTHPVRGATL